ncbi:MAG: FAD-binding oxidoreductase, partial [Lachnospiraceae bacterium]|nr:FAD-binding oxidoreductase [Lachnospiraceae bacterium]
MFLPQNTQEVCDIVRQAASQGKALVPCSSKEPHLHEGSLNPLAETISFEKMNHILKISRHDRYARVEAGVTFGTLLPALAEQGLRANHPFLPRAGKSVVASMLEREAVLVPKYQYDYTDPLLTTEVVYGTGELFRTGSAAGPAPAEETAADMVNPWGPGSVDFARFLCGAQGTMGLVTWATLKAEVAPTDSVLTFIESDDLASLVHLASKLLFRRIPDDCLILNNVNFAAAFAKDPSEEETLRKKAA